MLHQLPDFGSCTSVEIWLMHMQTKETLTLRATSFGSKCELPDKFVKKVGDSGVAERVLSFASFKQNKELKKSDGSKRTRITGAASEIHKLCFIQTRQQPRLHMLFD